MRRTLASPNLATSSKSPAAMRGDVLSASMRIANRRVRLSSGMFGPPLFVPERGHQYTSAVFGLPERGSRSGLETATLSDQLSHSLVLPFGLFQAYVGSCHSFPRSYWLTCARSGRTSSPTPIG